jgi:hypothetical protein
MHMLALHRIARCGDGLAPELIQLLSARKVQTADAHIVPLRRFNRSIPDVAGALPTKRRLVTIRGARSVAKQIKAQIFARLKFLRMLVRCSNEENPWPAPKPRQH